MPDWLAHALILCPRLRSARRARAQSSPRAFTAKHHSPADPSARAAAVQDRSPQMATTPRSAARTALRGQAAHASAAGTHR